MCGRLLLLCLGPSTSIFLSYTPLCSSLPHGCWAWQCDLFWPEAFIKHEKKLNKSLHLGHVLLKHHRRRQPPCYKSSSEWESHEERPCRMRGHLGISATAKLSGELHSDFSKPAFSHAKATLPAQPSQPIKSWEKYSFVIFKPLSFGVICYTVTGN